MLSLETSYSRRKPTPLGHARLGLLVALAAIVLGVILVLVLAHAGNSASSPYTGYSSSVREQVAKAIEADPKAPQDLAVSNVDCEALSGSTMTCSGGFKSSYGSGKITYNVTVNPHTRSYQINPTLTVTLTHPTDNRLRHGF